MKTFRRPVTVSEKHDAMAVEIMDEIGLTTFSQVVQYAIIELHTKLHPAYTKSKREKISQAQRIAEKKEEKELLEKEHHGDLMKLAEKLDGIITLDDAGNKMVTYYNYDRGSRFEQTVGLETLTDDLVKYQYSPNKATVLKLQKEGKIKYK